MWLDFRLTIRNVTKAPMLTALALVSLTLGIGANTAIFSVFNALLLRPLPIPSPNKLVYLSTAVPGEPDSDQQFTWQMFQRLRQEHGVFADVFSWNGGTLSNLDVNGARYEAALAQVSGNYFQTLGIRPFLGRFISESETGHAAGQSQPVAVISYRAWRAWFHADPSVVGRKLYIENKPFTVIGVQPENFAGLVIDGASDVSIPLFAPGLMQSPRDAKHLWYTLFARLKPNVSITQSQSRLKDIWPRILQASAPDEYTGSRRERFLSRRVRIQSAATGVSFLRKRFTNPLRFLQLAAVIILAIACLNLGSLFLAKAAARGREVAVQRAIGATPWDVARPHLVESLMLSVFGALLGVALSHPAAAFIVRTAWTGLVSTPLKPSIDMRVLGFATLTCVVTALLFGVTPALYALRAKPVGALREGRGTYKGGKRLRSLLLTAQLAMSIVLLSAAVLFVGTLHSLRTQDTGYRKDHFLTFLLFPQPVGSSNWADLNPYYQRLANAIRNLPGVDAASFSTMGPANEFEAFSQVYRSSDDRASEAVDETVAPDFFHVAGMRVIAGREFQWSDLTHKRPVAVISDSLAKHLFGTSDPIGHTVSMGPMSAATELTVVGVVNSARLWKVESVAPMAVYSLFGQKFQEYEPILDVRTSVDPEAMKPVIERVIRSLGYHESVRSMTIQERLDSYISVQKVTAVIAAFFGALALLIAAIGVYGLTAYNVASRTAEIGIRSALGAQRTSLVLLALRDSVVLALIGCPIGLAATLVGANWLRSLIFGVSPDSPTILCALLVCMLATVFVAALRPAWRAATIEPVVALRLD